MPNPLPSSSKASKLASKFLTIHDVAERLDVCDRTVQRWITQGELVAHKFGHIVRISEADFASFVASRRRIG